MALIEADPACSRLCVCSGSFASCVFGVVRIFDGWGWAKVFIGACPRALERTWEYTSRVRQGTSHKRAQLPPFLSRAQRLFLCPPLSPFSSSYASIASFARHSFLAISPLSKSWPSFGLLAVTYIPRKRPCPQENGPSEKRKRYLRSAAWQPSQHRAER